MDINAKTAKVILKALKIARHTVMFEYTKKELIANINGVEDDERLSFLDKQTSIIDFIDDLEKVERDFITITNRHNSLA
jgi:hypothetical protein